MAMVIFGTGNIGRSFVGQPFRRAGYRVILVDVDEALRAEPNQRGQVWLSRGRRTRLSGCWGCLR